MVQQLNTPALKKQWVLDAQRTDCPEEVEQCVQNLWRTYELGNDNYMLRRSIKDLTELNQNYEVEQWFWGETQEERKGWLVAPATLQPLINYLREKGIPEEEDVIIHWWW